VPISDALGSPPSETVALLTLGSGTWLPDGRDDEPLSAEVAKEVSEATTYGASDELDAGTSVDVWGVMGEAGLAAAVAGVDVPST
jgi:hypothetical protein